jgi:hypothetical protein
LLGEKVAPCESIVESNVPTFLVVAEIKSKSTKVYSSEVMASVFSTTNQWLEIRKRASYVPKHQTLKVEQNLSMQDTPSVPK